MTMHLLHFNKAYQFSWNREMLQQLSLGPRDKSKLDTNPILHNIQLRPTVNGLIFTIVLSCKCVAGSSTFEPIPV